MCYHVITNSPLWLNRNPKLRRSSLKKKVLFHPLRWLARQQQQTKQQEMQIDLKIINKWKQKIIYKNQGSLWISFVAGAKRENRGEIINSFLRLGQRFFFRFLATDWEQQAAKTNNNKKKMNKKFKNIFKYKNIMKKRQQQTHTKHARQNSKF